MVNRCGILSTLVVGMASIGFASVGPISYNDIGFNVPLTTSGPDVWLTGISGRQSDNSILPGEAGSNFLGTVNGTSTWLYCIDDQRDVGVPASYNTNVILLKDVAADSGSVSLGNSTDWTNQIAGANTATARYEMAAYLASNFSVSTDGSLTNGLGGTGADVAKNQAIQSAIWTLTNNTDIGANGISHPTDGTGADAGLTANQFWINQAEANYQSVNTSGWAVISFISGDGSLADVQTLLVQVTPEPGYSIALMLMLGGLMFVRYRRRRV